MLEKFKNKIDTRDRFIAIFLLKAIILYLVWYFVYDNWLLQNGMADHYLINHLVVSTQYILNSLGYTTFMYADAVGVDGTHGVLIGTPCNGLSLFALFSGFIIAFPGRFVQKLIFIPIGILIIHVLNILRVVGLALVVVYQPDSLSFNHKYTFTIIIYTCIFFMWMLWVKKFAILKGEDKNAKE